MWKKLLFGGAGGADRVSDFGLLVLRLIVGFYIAFGHGRFKLPPPDRFIGGIREMGLPAPELFGWLATLGELGGGILLMLGLLTRAGAFLVAATMTVAAFMAHGDDPWFAQLANGGRSKEMAVLFLAPALTLLLTGPGRYSIDRFIAKGGGKKRVAKSGE